MKSLHLNLQKIASLGVSMSAALFFASQAAAAPMAVSGLSPASTFVNAQTVFSANYVSGGATVDHCRLRIDGADRGLMTLSGSPSNTASLTTTVSTVDTHTSRVTCYNADESLWAWQERTFSVWADSSAPVLSAFTFTPPSLTAGSSATIQLNYDDTDFGSGINTCGLIIGGEEMGLMSLSTGVGSTAGLASLTFTYGSTGSKAVTVNCYDRSGNLGTRMQNVTFAAPPDTTAPVISSITPSSAAVNSNVTIRADVTDNVGVGSCTLRVDGTVQGSMSLSGSQATMVYVFTTPGSHLLQVNCLDLSANEAMRTGSINITASGPSDVVAPIVDPIANITPVENISITVSATYNDNVGVVGCTLFVDSINRGSMTITGVLSGTASKSYSFSTAGNHTVYVSCNDAASNTGTSVGRVISVATASGSDVSPPVVTNVNPTAATVNQPVTISASFSDNVAVASCRLYVNDADAGAMDLSSVVSGTASKSYTFTSTGGATARVSCTDTASNTGSGSTTVTVATAPVSSIYAYKLVKLTCPAGYIDVNHPCKAVYYVDATGKRHAFPNEKIYFTWYSDFASVIELDNLSIFALGKNVTYRPGVRMVKFMTLNKVYAVTRYGALRWVTSEGIATGLYGSSWNRMIDDISDAFFTDYSFGADINSVGDYNTTAEMNAVPTINLNL